MPACRPVRVLYCEANEDGTVGGSYQALFDIVRHLDRDAYCPVVLFYQESRFSTALRELGVEVHVWDDVRDAERSRYERPRGGWRKAVHLVDDIRRRAAFLKGSRIELLHMNNSIHVGCDDWLPAARWRRIPAVVNQMGILRRDAGSVRERLARRWTRVIAISRHVEEQLWSAGLPREKTRMVYLGIDLEALAARARRSPDSVRAELGVAPDQVMVSMVGHVRRWKGQRVLVQALVELPDDARARARVFFIGGVSDDERPYRQELERLIEESGLTHQVTFLGVREDVPELMRASDILVHASTHPEPFGLVVVEAMALGRAVIAAASGGPAEIIVPGTGLLFDPERPRELAAHLDALIHDESLRSSMGTRARERAGRFSASRMAMGVDRVYREILPGIEGNDRWPTKA